MGKGILGLCKEKALHRAAHAPLHYARRPEPAPSHGSRKALNLLTDLLTSKPEALRDSWRHRRFGQSIEKLPKLNVAGSSPVTRF
jgi:hypothetical protein